MISYLINPVRSEEIYSFLDEVVKEWFNSKFPKGFTPPQLYAIPSIHKKQNTLVFSSTGSGKTFAAFLASINELFILAKRGELKDQVYVLYISPLKALGNDIKKNLEEPLKSIQDLGASKGVSTPNIRVGVRTGDTSQAERNKMRTKPPHILITTPESLGLILASPKFSLKLRNIQWIIVDEIHELANNKRGAFLSLYLEYLQNKLAKNPITRIGLSATQSPVEEIARFLVGQDKEGRERACSIANLPSSRRFDLQAISPVRDLLHTPYSEIQQSIYSILSDLVLDHETSLIFTNTRRGAESVAFKLKEYLGEGYSNRIAVHHSSIAKDTRLEVEDKLKNNELLAAVSSTSLELGIDIGSVELVAQIGSPKTVAKYLQRVGRSGHSLKRIAKGRLIVTDRDDAIECAVLNKAAYVHDLDKVQIPENCLDVLAQFIVGISIIKRWNIDEAYEIIRASYNYRNLSYDDYLDTIKYLSGHYTSLEEGRIYRKIWYDEKEKAFGKKKNTRIVFYLNIGTIPESADYSVELETYRTRLGVLSESFVERLSPGDIFVLGSHTYQFKRTVGSRVIVADAFGRRPTIPSWVGEMLPRSFELSQQIGRFIKVIASKIENEEKDIEKWIIESFRTDKIIANTIIDYIKEQLSFLHYVPSHDTILIESFFDPQNRLNIVFHSYCGRRVNDALSKAYAYAIGSRINADIASAVNDNGFILILPSNKFFDINEISTIVTSSNLEELIKRAIINTELFQLRFRHVSNRALMILKHSGTRKVPVSRQSLYAKRILPTIKENTDFCVIKETYREIMRDYMDLTNAVRILQRIENKTMRFIITSLTDIPSPLAHGIVLLGSSDIIQISDKSALLRELHKMVLSKVFGDNELKETLFSKELVDRIFRIRSYTDNDIPINTIKQLLKAIKALSPINVITDANPSVFHLSINDPLQIRKWVLQLLNMREIIEVPISPYNYRAVSIDDYALFWNLYVVPYKPKAIDKQIITLIKKVGPLSINEIAKEMANEDKKVINSIITKLERAFVLYRTNYKNEKGKISWKYDITENLPYLLLLQAKKLDPEECLTKVILRYLTAYGPSTDVQIAEYLNIKKERIERALKELEERSLILKGKITDYYSGDQYIRIEDRELLRKLSNIENNDLLFFTYEELQFISYYYLINKFRRRELKGKEDIIKVLNAFGSLEKINSLAIRISNFSLEEFQELVKENRIIQARLSHGRVEYVTAELFPYYYVAYKTEFNLSNFDKLILDTLSKYGELSKREIIEYTELDEDIVRESLAVLDNTLYICRKPIIAKSINYRPFIANVYEISSRFVNSKNLPSFEESIEYIIYLKIKTMGPLSLLQLTQITGFKYNNIETAIKRLLSEKKIVEKALSNNQTNYYITNERAKELIELKKQFIHYRYQYDNDIIIVPRSDPYVRLGIRIRLREQYNEGNIDPILFNGQAIGSVEYKIYTGKYLQIYNLDLADETVYDIILLQKLAEALVNYTRTIHKVLSLQIEDINTKSILSKDNEIIKEVFLKAGYRLINAVLIGGEATTRFFPSEIIKEFKLDSLFLQSNSNHLSMQQLKEIIDNFGKIRLNELLARFPETNDSIIIYLLNKLLDKQEIFYQNDLFYSREFMILRKAGLRRRKRLNENHKSVLKIIQRGFTKLDQLQNKWKEKNKSIRPILEALADDLKIATKELSITGESIEFFCINDKFDGEKIDIGDAKKRYLLRIIKSMGLAKEDQIAIISQIAGVLTKVRIKETLALMVNDGSLISGRFKDGSTDIYYISREDYERLLGFEQYFANSPLYKIKKSARHITLPPEDRAQVALEEYFPDTFEPTTRAYLILTNSNLIAQIILEKVSSKEIIIENVALKSSLTEKTSFHQIINAIESLPKFYNNKQNIIVIKRINNIRITDLEVK